MFESDIERSKIRLLELVNTTQSYVYLHDILGRSTVDYAYKQYFEAEFGWWLYEEQTLRLANPNLDLSDPGAQTILNSLDAQYRKNARFDREQLMLIIDASVKSVLNFRVRPRTALKWFVYRGEPTKPVYEVFLRMRFFADYRYLHEGFNQWLLKRGLRYDSMDIISVLEFEKLIKKIDDDTILELSPSQFVELISPINFFFADPTLEPDKQSVPIEAIIVFLDDKEVYIIAQKLERMLYQQGIRFLTKEMFLNVVDEVLSEVEDQGMESNIDSSQESITGARVSSTHGIEEMTQLFNDRSGVADLEDDETEMSPTSETSAQPSDSAAAIPADEQSEAAESEAAKSKLENSKTESAEQTEESPLQHSPLSVIEQLSVSSHAATVAEDTVVSESGTVSASTSDAARRPDIYMDSVRPVSHTSAIPVPIVDNPVPSAFVRTNTESALNVVPTEDEAYPFDHQSVPVAVESAPQPTLEANTGTEILGIISRALGNDVESDERQTDVRSPAPRPSETINGKSKTEFDDTTSHSAFPSLRNFFDEKQRESYVRKLCNRDEHRFTALVTILDATTNWKDALATLDKFYSQESINPQSSVARDFRMAVYKRFITI